MASWTPDLTARSGPRYRAIADALADDIDGGRLPAGSRLPTHRDLAYRLGVTVGTVTRAYSEAEKRGLIGGEVGRGTFVLDRGVADPAGRDPAFDPMTGPAAPPLAAPMPGSAAFYAPVEPALINMSAVKPTQSAAAEALAATLTAIAATADPRTLIEYGSHAGLPAHRAAAAEWLARWHRAAAGADRILLVTGAQNAMAVAMAAVARPGDVVLTERLTNYGMKTLAATLGLFLEGVAMDGHGLIPDAFDAACRRLGPKALYTVPTLHNPTACVMPEARREEIAAIARRHGVLIVEDDVFGFMVDGVRPFQALAPDVTVYLTGLSKSVAAGLRIGYLTGPSAVLPRMEAAIRSFHYACPTLPAEVASRWIVDGTADRIARSQREEDEARQRSARAILPSAAVSGSPASSHLWLVLPEPWRRDDFVSEARRRGVLVVGADAFAVGRASAPHAVRVCLCQPKTREEMIHGVSILAELMLGPATGALSIL